MAVTTRQVERLLVEAGVPDSTNPPYRTGLRPLFSELAAMAMRAEGVGRIDQLDDRDRRDLVRNACSFIRRGWHDMATDDHGQVPDAPILRASRIGFQSDGMLTLSGGPQGRRASFHPSISRSGLVRARTLKAADFALAVARAERLAPAAIDIIRGDTPEVASCELDATIDRSWHGASIYCTMEDHRWIAVQWSADALAHRSDEDLIQEARHVRDEIRNGVWGLIRLRTAHPDVDERLVQEAERSGLPVTISLAPSPQGRDMAAGGYLVVDGYGQDGTRRRNTAGFLSMDDMRHGTLANRVEGALVDQHVLHKRFGPEPGSQPIDWRIDAVTAAQLGTEADLHVARALRDGSTRVNSRVQVRVAGKRLLGTVVLSDAAVWKGDRLQLTDVALPDAVFASIKGRPVEEVVDSPLLRGAGTITGASRDTYHKRPRVTLKVKPTMTSAQGATA